MKRIRRSIRLKDYDYAGPGAYFVTICTQNRLCLFGDIADGEMALNDAGCMVDKWWEKLRDKYDAVEIDEYVVMPNHFHGIIVITTRDSNVGAIPRNRPDGVGHGLDDIHRKQFPGENMVSPLRGLGQYVSWFKRMATNEYIRGVKQYNWQTFSGKLWQRNYYEHIIRDGDELHRVREYIINNPAGWASDRENPYATVGAIPRNRPWDTGK